MIDQYVSGSYIKVAGKKYFRDLKIVSGTVRADWWRKDGHRLVAEDIEDILAEKPDVLVVGTGYAGRLVISAELLQLLSSTSIHVIAEPTQKATQTFNRLHGNHRHVDGAFHLTW